MIDTFRKEILKLRNKKYVNKKIVQQFFNRLETNPHFTEQKSIHDHFGAFFVPLHKKTKEIFIAHHKKAAQWIPPGGHIKQNETPMQTVVREFYEELRIKLSNEKIDLFDLGITLIKDTKQPCKIHYDFWYVVFIKRINFKFDSGEFYQAEWLPIEEAIYRATQKSIIYPLMHLKTHFNEL